MFIWAYCINKYTSWQFRTYPHYYLNKFHNVVRSFICYIIYNMICITKLYFAADGRLVLCSYRFYADMRFTINGSYGLDYQICASDPRNPRNFSSEAECWLVLTSILVITTSV